MASLCGTVAKAGRDITPEHYARAERFLPWNADRLLFQMGIDPRWIDGTDRFWYRSETAQGPRCRLIDPDAGTAAPAFDHVRLAASLSRASGISFDSDGLDLGDLVFDDDPVSLTFTALDRRWVWNIASDDCAVIDAPAQPAADVVRSPDGRWDVFTRDHNLWLRRVADSTERRLTDDGAPGNGYGAPLPSPLASAGLADPDRPVAHWAPDSSRFLSCRIDERPARQLHLLQSVPKNGETRPRLHSYAYPLPGDTEVPLAEGWIFPVDEADPVRLQMQPLPMAYYGAPFQDNSLWWTLNGSRLFLLTRERGGRSYELHAIDAATGTDRDVIIERTERGIDPFLLWADVNVRVIGDGSQVIWFAQRDGWGHLYLYDMATGKQIRQLTSGAHNVSGIAHIDEREGWVAFMAIGREPGGDPYLNHLYRVSLDGGEPELLTPEDADHTVRFSPSGAFFVDIASRTDIPPVTRLRRSTGQLVLELERADVSSLLATGWTAPERFTAKARDGVTDVYGVVVRPTVYDPNGSYPVIDYIYAGPQVNVAPTTFTDAMPFADSFRSGRGSGFWQAQAIAELGFVVVMVDGLGMPGRSRAYHDVSYRNLGDGGIPDHIAAIRQLGDRDPALDLSLVGIYGHSAGGYASARAILSYPDFYRVCVSSAGNHDHRLDKASWVERYMSPEIGEHYDEQANRTRAGNLSGKLLLAHGEMDENVHPASTLALVDALIRANRDFDLLIIPNRPHRLDDDPYFVRRRWDFFVRHLLGAEPPTGYRIAEPPAV